MPEAKAIYESVRDTDRMESFDFFILSDTTRVEIADAEIDEFHALLERTGGQSRIFTWDGKTQPAAVKGVELQGINPEGISFHAGNGKEEYFLLSDDGTVAVDGMECKNLKDPAQKRFRGRVVTW